MRASQMYKIDKYSQPNVESIIKYLDNKPMHYRESVIGENDLVLVISMIHHAKSPDQEAAEYISKFVRYFCIEPVTRSSEVNEFLYGISISEKELLCSVYNATIPYCSDAQFRTLIGIMDDRDICEGREH